MLDYSSILRVSIPRYQVIPIGARCKAGTLVSVGVDGALYALSRLLEVLHL
jgi:hypothetical protein